MEIRNCHIGVIVINMKMKQKYVVVNKETLGKIVILTDQGQKLAEALEDNNQELRILLHSLILDSNKKSKIKYREHLLLPKPKKIKK